MPFGWIRRLWGGVGGHPAQAEPFPQGWEGILRRNVRHDALLAEAERAKLREDLRVFVAGKHWEGCGGLVLTDEIKVTIAAQACLIALALEPGVYDRVETILVYPRTFAGEGVHVRDDGIVEEGERPHLGEAWYRGPVILSWADAKRGGRRGDDGVNVVIHEFAHQIDMLATGANGAPPLPKGLAARWQEVMRREYDRLCEAADADEETLLDPYGAEDEAEFFAVATECFFERPAELRGEHPDLYDVLRAFWRQDPAARLDHL